MDIIVDGHVHSVAGPQPTLRIERIATRLTDPLPVAVGDFVNITPSSVREVGERMILQLRLAEGIEYYVAQEALVRDEQVICDSWQVVLLSIEEYEELALSEDCDEDFYRLVDTSDFKCDDTGGAGCTAASAHQSSLGKVGLGALLACLLLCWRLLGSTWD